PNPLLQLLDQNLLSAGLRNIHYSACCYDHFWLKPNRSLQPDAFSPNDQSSKFCTQLTILFGHEYCYQATDHRSRQDYFTLGLVHA
ncbi:hypothetical protein NPIL_217371, partial [Nephila pilipes]